MSRVVELPPESLPRPDGTLAGGWWHESDEAHRIVCDLCPRECALRPGDRGFCFVRENRGGEMVLTTYGRSTGFCIDPIEKKPLNQFYPGTSVLSFGTAGCNLGCKFCQNWSISKSREIEQLSEQASPEAIAAAALQLGCRAVAFTYNDPVIWAEYAIDSARACRAVGVKTVAVTAGYITPQARGPFYEFIDAANVDLKGFTEEFYRHLTLSHLQPVLDTLRWLKHESNVWLEITNLVIPRANDSLEEIGQMCDWILEAIGPDVPLHFTAFHPDFRLTDRPNTPVETLLSAYELARSRGLNYVYVGNVHAPQQQATYCPGCRRPLIARVGYALQSWNLRGNCCEFCGTKIAGHYDPKPGNWGSRRQPVRISAFAKNPGNSRPEGTQSKPMTATQSSTIEPPALRTEWTADQEQGILRAAGQLVTAATLGITPVINDASLAGAASLPVMGAFVSLKRQGKLRSCCGFLGQSAPLLQALQHAAGRTANDDHRFPPVSPSELPYLDLEVWLLGNSQKVAAQGENRRHAVTIGKHGLQISRGSARGLLLPGVAVENGLDAEAFLQQVCIKAGLPVTAWCDADTELSTFEGHAIHGQLAALIGNLPIPAAALPCAVPDAIALAEFCRANIKAVVHGATPSFYSPGVADGNVYGIAINLRGPEGAVWFETSRLSFRQSMPLQSTLYSLAEALGKSVQRANLDGRSLDLAVVGLLVLVDPAMHGTVAEPDMRGADPARRAIVVMEGSKSAVVFNPLASADELLAEAARQADVRIPEAAQVFSLATVCNLDSISVAQVPRPVAGPSVRQAAMAGRFYPAAAAELESLVDRCLTGPAIQQENWPAVMVPHAGLIYSGRIAADVLRRVQIPETVIVIGPKHTPYGVEWSVAPHEIWSLPGRNVAADPDLARRLVAAIPGLELDAAAHAQEHAIEVELPFLARLAPKSRVVGVAIGSGNLARCREFAAGLAQLLAEMQPRPLLVISSDMNHFATDVENRRLDEIALSAMERLDPAVLFEEVTRQRISMCGLLPAVMVMETLKLLGGLTRCRRTSYATSADVTGDTSRVVGYAGMLLA